MTSSRAYLCVSIDVECDKGKGWRAQHPLAFAGVHEAVVRRLQPMFASFGAKPTYLLSPEVLRDAACLSALTAIEASAELGTHLHGEYAEPDAFEPDVASARQRDYSPELERKKLTYVTDLFIRAFGHQPLAFRGGCWGIGESSVGILESLGYTVDSSVTPGANGWDDAPVQPYHPDTVAPGRVGDAALLEVPVTIQKPWRALPFVRAQPRWLRPTRGTTDELVRVAEDAIAEARRRAPGRPVVLNTMLHAIEVVPGTSPHAATEDEAHAILGRLRGLLDFARREAIAVVGLGDVPDIVAG